MIRVGEAAISYRGCVRTASAAEAVSRQALALVARRPPATGGHRGHLTIVVRVPHGMADAAIAERIADAIRRRI